MRRSARRLVRDRLLPPARPNRWAVICFLLCLSLPLRALLALLDLLLYGLVTGVLGRCYGLACLWDWSVWRSGRGR
jgi:hypothetical protein